MHAVDALFEAMPGVEPYPPGVVRVPAMIPGIAFFPGGRGLWGVTADHVPPMPTRGVMVLGHDFHSEAAFARSLSNRTAVTALSDARYRFGPTWRNLFRLLDECEIRKEACFFTNAFMGLREGSANTGRFPGSRDSAFVDRCRRFLLRQLAAQDPAVVLTLGKWVPAFVAPLSPPLAGWSRARRLESLDAGSPVVHGVRFDANVGGPCSLVALTHPSLRGPNVRRRRYGEATGHAAEVAMIREALTHAPITMATA